MRISATFRPCAKKSQFLQNFLRRHANSCNTCQQRTERANLQCCLRKTGMSILATQTICHFSQLSPPRSNQSGTRSMYHVPIRVFMRVFQGQQLASKPTTVAVPHSPLLAETIYHVCSTANPIIYYVAVPQSPHAVPLPPFIYTLQRSKSSALKPSAQLKYSLLPQLSPHLSLSCLPGHVCYLLGYVLTSVQFNLPF